VAPGGVEHLKRTLHIRADELGGPVDRAIDVRLGREVNDRRRVVLGQGAIDVSPLGDVAADKGVTGVILDGTEESRLPA